MGKWCKRRENADRNNNRYRCENKRENNEPCDCGFVASESVTCRSLATATSYR